MKINLSTLRRLGPDQGWRRPLQGALTREAPQSSQLALLSEKRGMKRFLPLPLACGHGCLSVLGQPAPNPTPLPGSPLHGNLMPVKQPKAFHSLIPSNSY